MDAKGRKQHLQMPMPPRGGAFEHRHTPANWFQCGATNPSAASLSQIPQDKTLWEQVLYKPKKREGLRSSAVYLGDFPR